MNRAIPVYSPVVISFRYDSLFSANGTTGINAVRIGKPLRLSELSIYGSIEANEPQGFGALPGVSYFRGPKEDGDRVMKSQWAVWVSGTNLRYGRVGTISPPASTIGSLAPFSLDGEKPTRISGAITALGKLAVAYQSDAVIKIKHEGKSPIAPFIGESPVLFFTGLLLGSVDEGEVACYYLKAENPGIYMRLESENYALEKVLLPTIPIEMGFFVAARTRDNKLEILAKDAYGRSVIFRSDNYITEHSENRSVSISFFTGTPITAVNTEAVDEESELGIEFTSGVTADPLVSSDPESNASAASVEFVSGLAFYA